MRTSSKELLEQLKSINAEMSDSEPEATQTEIPENVAESAVAYQTESAVPAPTRHKAKTILASEKQVAFSWKSEEKLQRQEATGGWSRDDLLGHLIDEMPKAFPKVEFDGEVLAELGIYRRIYRSADKACLHMLTPKTAYYFTTLRTSEDYRRWWHYYNGKGVQDAATPAAEMMIYELEEFLLSFEDYSVEGWMKVIDSEAYIIHSR